MDKYGEQLHYKDWHVTKHAMSRYRSRCSHFPLKELLDGARLSGEQSAFGGCYEFESIRLVVAENGNKREVITMYPKDEDRVNMEHVGYLQKARAAR